MKINKAIEILTILESRSINNSAMFKKDALKLGIEALRFIQYLREHGVIPERFRLDGETE